jgi:xanthine dehydrogenase YagS FAD-binding subunit
VKPFRYERAVDPAGAVATLSEEPTGKYIGGGTNLVDLMKLGVESPELLVDVSRLDLGGVTDTAAGGLHIGASVRNSDLAAHPAVRRRYPVLAEGLLAGASGQLRNMATVGGNLLQRTRCRYFQDIERPCNKRSPGTGCPARDGEHHNLAILGTSPACIATHPSDMAVAMVALDAVVHLRGAGGERDLPVGDFYRLPGDRPELDTTMEQGELITGVTLPPVDGRHSAYRKVRERASFAFAVVSVAAIVQLSDDGMLADVRLAIGGVAHMPWRAQLAEQVLRGGPADRDAVREAIDQELAAASPLPGNRYKVGLVRNLVVAMLSELAVGAGEVGR